MFSPVRFPLASLSFVFATNFDKLLSFWETPQKSKCPVLEKGNFSKPNVFFCNFVNMLASLWKFIKMVRSLPDCSIFSNLSNVDELVKVRQSYRTPCFDQFVEFWEIGQYLTNLFQFDRIAKSLQSCPISSSLSKVWPLGQKVDKFAKSFFTDSWKCDNCVKQKPTDLSCIYSYACTCICMCM